MRLSNFPEPNLADEFITISGSVTGSLILYQDPSQPNEAATKQYVDNAIANFDIGNLTSGTLSPALLPAFTGDLTSSAGTGVLTLTGTGITPGAYTKVTVDAKGRVTSGAGLSTSDIPNLDWSSITTGKPTTLAGYGITDAANKNGDTLTGPVSISLLPTSPNQLVNKQYVDNQSASSSSSSGFEVGDIIAAPFNVTPTGFLKCDGAELDKTTYADLYAVIGNKFTTGSGGGSGGGSGSEGTGNGKPWRFQYDINTSQSAPISGWIIGNPLASSVTNAQAIVSQNKAYLLGGQSPSGFVSTIQTAPINPDGTLGAWTVDSSVLPVSIGYSQAVVAKGRIYLIGGIETPGPVANVFSAPINPDGTIGTWRIEPQLPQPAGNASAIVIQNKIHLIAGWDLYGETDVVYTTTLDSTGALSPWVNSSPLPVRLAKAQTAVVNGNIYVFGGYTSSGPTNTIYKAPINSDGTIGTWSSSGQLLPDRIGGSQAIVTKNRIYLVGIEDIGGNLSYVYSASIDVNGVIGPWGTDSSLPGPLTNTQAIVTSTRVYLLGGFNGYGGTSDVYVAPFSGGLDDYSAYFGASSAQTSPTFNVPDYTSYGIPNISYYIKY